MEALPISKEIGSTPDLLEDCKHFPAVVRYGAFLTSTEIGSTPYLQRDWECFQSPEVEVGSTPYFPGDGEHSLSPWR
jgi:hypothetical protein